MLWQRSSLIGRGVHLGENDGAIGRQLGVPATAGRLFLMRWNKTRYSEVMMEHTPVHTRGDDGAHTSTHKR